MHQFLAPPSTIGNRPTARLPEKKLNVGFDRFDVCESWRAGGTASLNRHYIQM
jgi:hypothetical protein